jgi:hypothetical protein
MSLTAYLVLGNVPMFDDFQSLVLISPAGTLFGLLVVTAIAVCNTDECRSL